MKCLLFIGRFIFHEIECNVTDATHEILCLSMKTMSLVVFDDNHHVGEGLKIDNIVWLMGGVVRDEVVCTQLVVLFRHEKTNPKVFFYALYS